MRVNWSPSDLVASKADDLSKRKSSSQKDLQVSAEQFEAIFLYQLLEQMRRTVPETDLLGDRKAEDFPIHAGSGDGHYFSEPECWVSQDDL